MADHARFKLGKLPPREDSRTLKLARYAADLPPPPDELDLVTRVSPSFMMYRNAELGDCTCAALGHALHFWGAANGTYQPPTDDDILKAYRESCGYDPADPSTDRGGIMLLVARYFCKTGIGGHRPEFFLALDPANETHLKHAVNLGGGAYVGLNLPMSTIQQDRDWHVSMGGTEGDPSPGSRGGHAIWLLPKYNKRGIWGVTWAGLVFMTWAWWEVHNDEGYVFLSRDWADADGAPNGLPYERIREDLAKVRA